MAESFLCSLRRGEDLLESITRAFQERGIRKAAFNLIGATTRAVVGYYDPELKQYMNNEFEGLREIVSCMGNLSEKDGESFIHAHIVLAGGDYRCVGGHLMPGTVIFVGELFGMFVLGPVPVRRHNEATGLALWTEP